MNTFADYLLNTGILLAKLHIQSAHSAVA